MFKTTKKVKLARISAMELKWTSHTLEQRSAGMKL